MTSSSVDFNDRLIGHAIRVARKNWRRWSEVFEHGLPVASNPLLASQQKFRSFCAEYRVARTIRHGMQNEPRLELAGSQKFLAAIHEDSGQLIDEIEENLRPRFGAGKHPKRMISVLSKVAAFVRPERFVAWDRYARKGLNVTLGRSASSTFQAYADYLAAFDQAWEGTPGERIRDHAMRSDGQDPLHASAKFPAART
jgi:hypothetical protein